MRAHVNNLFLQKPVDDAQQMTLLFFSCYIREMPNLTLYNYFRSSTSYRVRIALELKGLKYAYSPVSLVVNGGEQNLPAYRQLNPLGGVPTLIHNGNAISQSFAIIEYLDEIFPQPVPLFLKDAFESAKIRQLCETINADIHPLQNLKVTQYLESQLNATAEQKSKWINKWITEGLKAFEESLQPFAGKYCFGDNVTAADLFLIPQLFSALRFGVDISSFKKLNQINDNCLLLAAFKNAHPFRQPDTPAEFRIP